MLQTTLFETICITQSQITSAYMYTSENRRIIQYSIRLISAHISSYMYRFSMTPNIITPQKNNNSTSQRYANCLIKMYISYYLYLALLAGAFSTPASATPFLALGEQSYHSKAARGDFPGNICCSQDDASDPFCQNNMPSSGVGPYCVAEISSGDFLALSCGVVPSSCSSSSGSGSDAGCNILTFGVDAPPPQAYC